MRRIVFMEYDVETLIPDDLAGAAGKDPEVDILMQCHHSLPRFMTNR